MSKKTLREQNDMDGDGKVTREEIMRHERMVRLENQDQKEDQLRKMSWVAMLSMIIFTIALFLPFIDNERIEALDSILQMFYIAQSGVVATFFGTTAYMNRNRDEEE